MAYGIWVGGMLHGPDLLGEQSMIASCGCDHHVYANGLSRQVRKRTHPLFQVCRGYATDRPCAARRWGRSRLGAGVEPRCRRMEPMRATRESTADMLVLWSNQRNKQVTQKETEECGQRPGVLPQPLVAPQGTEEGP